MYSLQIEIGSNSKNGVINDTWPTEVLKDNRWRTNDAILRWIVKRTPVIHRSRKINQLGCGSYRIPCVDSQQKHTSCITFVECGSWRILCGCIWNSSPVTISTLRKIKIPVWAAVWILSWQQSVHYLPTFIRGKQVRGCIRNSQHWRIGLVF